MVGNIADYMCSTMVTAYQIETKVAASLAVKESKIEFRFKRENILLSPPTI